MARNVLRVDLDFDFTTIGIVSSLKNYRLCYEINQLLQTNLVRYDDVIVETGKSGANCFFNSFCDESNAPEKLFLLNNKGDNGFFFNEHKNLEYLLIVQNPSKEFLKESFISLLRSVPAILGVFDIEFENLRSKENLLYLG